MQFDEEKVGRAMELVKPKHFTRLPGSHHFHADPDTAERVVSEVLEVIRTKL